MVTVSTEVAISRLVKNLPQIYQLQLDLVKQGYQVTVADLLRMFGFPYYLTEPYLAVVCLNYAALLDWSTIGNMA